MLAVSALPSIPLPIPSLPLRPSPLLLPLRSFLRRRGHRSHLRLRRRGGFPAPDLHNARASLRAGIVIDVAEVSDIGDRDLPVDVSLTRRLPPALTVNDGLHALRRAADEAKSSPPGVGSGVIRFEVSSEYGRDVLVFVNWGLQAGL
jgi:isochorismate synthase / 2-succinyl-5-enolpyruvyl-6-hydroxy-3-cyclohexene-1-carboxylate synthase / 2-succinyl-6-hydroxy-2,4-cyclohexadiene-1-carboxylate synthase / o-succinylbenzoate synthase